MVAGYGVAFYIASGLQADGTIPYFGENLGQAFMYSYSVVLGNFDPTIYSGMGTNQWITLLLVFTCTFLGSIVLLNMIIAIMNDTY